MNEEEKQAIEYEIELKYVTNKEFNINECFYILKKRYFSDDTELKAINYLEQFIDKQQKEIERLKDEYKREVFEHQEFVEDTKVAVQDYIKKYKIKEKIKELEEMPENQYIHLDYIKKMLEELLGE